MTSDPNETIADPVCPACGHPVYLGDGFCEACGQRLGAEPAAVAAVPLCADCGAPEIDADGYCGRCGMRQPAARDSSRDHVELETHPGGPAGVTDRGVRHHNNEDAMSIAIVPAPPGAPPGPYSAVAAVVCDGVSSSPRPQDASRVAADTGAAALVKELESGADPESASRVALEQSAAAVAGLASSEHDAPACTIVASVVTGGAVTIAWVGDSRAYFVDAAGGGERLTEDDSWAGQMVQLGALSEEEAAGHRNAHVLVAWLGADAGALNPHVRTFTPGRPGAVVVCSDGLWNYYPEAAAIGAAVAEAGAPLAAAQRLTRMALDAGGHDNITVVVVPFAPVEAPH